MIQTLAVNTASPTRDLTTLAAVKTDLQVSGTADDAYLSELIRQASDLIGTYCRRPEGFGRETVTETFRPGRAVDMLILTRDLAVSVTSVTEDGVALTGSDWLLDGSLIYRLVDDSPIAWTASKIVVAYQAGYTLVSSLPYDVERCCLDLVSRAWSGRGRDPALRSERILDVIAQSWDTGGGEGFTNGMPNDIGARLSPYCRYVV